LIEMRELQKEEPRRGECQGSYAFTQNALPTQTEHNWATTACL
jgi:hypothetical protein